MRIDIRPGLARILGFVATLILGFGSIESRAQNFFNTRDLSDFTGTTTLIDTCGYHLSLERSGRSSYVFENGSTEVSLLGFVIDDFVSITNVSYKFLRASVDDSDPEAVEVTITVQESTRYVDRNGNSLSDHETFDLEYYFDSTAECNAPEITSQPQNQNVGIGSTAVFEVSLTGSAYLRYQWYKNGNVIEGETDRRLRISDVNESDVGTYKVSVRNSVGEVESNLVELNVGDLPEIVSGPISQTAMIGDSVIFTVSATGPEPLEYQWYKGDTPISGATSASYSINEVGLSNEGSYTVKVSNLFGQVESIAARLNLASITNALQMSIQHGPKGSSTVRLNVGNINKDVPLELWFSNDLVNLEFYADFPVDEETASIHMPYSDFETMPVYWRVQQDSAQGGIGGPAFGDNYSLLLVDGIYLDLMWIEPGTFMMGSPVGEEGRGLDEIQHFVTLTDGYWMGKYEVTQEQWEIVMGSNPSHFDELGEQAPVEKVSWEDAQEFIKKLNESERTAGRLPEGYEYALPTEAQWEYACRAGTTTVFAYGNSLSSTQANFKGTHPYGGAPVGPFLDRTTAVKSYEPNAWELYDMHGNVYEWCEDWYDYDYPTGPVTNPVGPASGSYRVTRGGSWYNLAEYCRSAYRGRSSPSYRFSFIGFRLSLRSK